MTIKDPFYFDTSLPNGQIPFLDSHAHLQDNDYDNDRDEVIQRAKDSGLESVICIGTDLQDSQGAINLALQYPDFIAPTIGYHPYNADLPIQDLKDLFQKHKDIIVGIGETGLDYFRSPVSHSIQKQSFIDHCLLAKEYDLPVIIHLREFQDTFEDAWHILEQTNIKKAVFHCYTGNLESAQKIWAKGYKTSFSLITFYPKNQDLLQVYQSCPRDLCLIETDAPYLPPQNRRGKRNEPSYLKEYFQ